MIVYHRTSRENCWKNYYYGIICGTHHSSLWRLDSATTPGKGWVIDHPTRFPASRRSFLLSNLPLAR
jgi:hypothetical protein